MKLSEKHVFELRMDGSVFHYATRDLVGTAINEGLELPENAAQEEREAAALEFLRRDTRGIFVFSSTEEAAAELKRREEKMKTAILEMLENEFLTEKPGALRDELKKILHDNGITDYDEL